MSSEDSMLIEAKILLAVRTHILQEERVGEMKNVSLWWEG